MDLSRAGIAGLIFDKDGTLFDFHATWGAWARDLLHRETTTRPEMREPLARALGFDLEAGRFHKSSLVIASTAREVATAALPYLPDDDVDTVMARFNAAAARAPQVEAAPLGPLLGRLGRAGLTLGVATNDAEAPARAHLRAAGVEGCFAFIAGSDSGHGGKPAPGQLLAFCAATGLDPAACAMVGDSTHDLHAGRAAGMTTIAVLTGPADHADLAPHADVVLVSIAEVPGVLGLPDAP